jgi:hypothetical protein
MGLHGFWGAVVGLGSPSAMASALALVFVMNLLAGLGRAAKAVWIGAPLNRKLLLFLWDGFPGRKGKTTNIIWATLIGAFGFSGMFWVNVEIEGLKAFGNLTPATEAVIQRVEGHSGVLGMAQGFQEAVGINVEQAVGGIPGMKEVSVSKAGKLVIKSVTASELAERGAKARAEARSREAAAGQLLFMDQLRDFSNRLRARFKSLEAGPVRAQALQPQPLKVAEGTPPPHAARNPPEALEGAAGPEKEATVMFVPPTKVAGFSWKAPADKGERAVPAPKVRSHPFFRLPPVTVIAGRAAHSTEAAAPFPIPGREGTRLALAEKVSPEGGKTTEPRAGEPAAGKAGPEVLASLGNGRLKGIPRMTKGFPKYWTEENSATWTCASILCPPLWECVNVITASARPIQFGRSSRTPTIGSSSPAPLSSASPRTAARSGLISPGANP